MMCAQVSEVVVDNNSNLVVSLCCIRYSKIIMLVRGLFSHVGLDYIWCKFFLEENDRDLKNRTHFLHCLMTSAHDIN